MRADDVAGGPALAASSPRWILSLRTGSSSAFSSSPQYGLAVIPLTNQGQTMTKIHAEVCRSHTSAPFS